MDTILFALWFFLPAGLANAAPALANKIPVFNKWHTPMDFGKHFRDKRIFGDNKTWRGLLSGIILGAVVAFVQYSLFYEVKSAGLDSLVRTAAAGGLLGFGALMGDAIESFFKRQLGVPSGESWFPFDQVDYIIGGLLASLAMVRLAAIDYVAIISVYFCLHLIVGYFWFVFGFKDKPM